MKLTKRKGFNFFRSYYDVYNELSDKDKVQFMDALLDRQFLGVKPNGLKGMSKFAYISQTNSIDSQVKGYNDKAQSLGTPPLGGAVGGAVGVNKKDLTPSQQVQEKGKGKEEEQYVMFDKFWDFYDKKRNKDKTLKLFNKLNELELESIRIHLPQYLDSTPNKQFRKDPDVYLRNKCWNDEIVESKEPIKQQARL